MYCVFGVVISVNENMAYLLALFVDEHKNQGACQKD